MIPRLLILRTKSRHGLHLPLNSRRTIDGQTVEVWGLIRKQVNNQAVIQWWIVNLVQETNPPPLRRRRGR